MDRTANSLLDARAPNTSHKIEAYGALLVLVASAIALGLAPLLMPASYSWVSRTTSESAAQGIDGAWLARLGFLLFGLAAIWAVRIAGQRWGIAASIMFALFGALMTAAAAFSHMPWEPDVAFDRTEDLLHSVAATGLGFAFAFGVASVAFQQGFSKRPRAVDLIAIAASVILPLGMSIFPDYDGILQRLMFLIAYGWFAHELRLAS